MIATLPRSARLSKRAALLVWLVLGLSGWGFVYIIGSLLV